MNSQDPARVAVILVQLGSPENAKPESVKKFLREFLSDSDVIQMSRWLWLPILHGIILNTRPPKSALLYERFFGTYGRTLHAYTHSLAHKLENIFLRDHMPLEVVFAMRYGTPALKNVLQRHEGKNLFIVPLFPQYSQTTTGSVERLATRERANGSFKILKHFHNNAYFIESICRVLEISLQQRPSPPQRLVLSYHGLPRSYVQKGDPYHEQCLKTTELVSQKINFPKENILHAYQSRFGRQEWLKPYTDQVLIDLAKNGIQDVMIAFPGFTMDCLETLDEVGVTFKKIFSAHGAMRLELVSCLNDGDVWAENLAQMIKKKIREYSLQS